MQVPLSTLIPPGFFPEPLRSIAELTEIGDYKIVPIEGGVEISLVVLPSGGPIEVPPGADIGLAILIEQLATISIRIADELHFEIAFDRLTVRLPEFLRPASLQGGRWVRDETQRQTILFESPHGGLTAFWDSASGFGIDWPTDPSGAIDIPSITLSPTMLGSSGIVFSVTDLDLELVDSSFTVAATLAEIHLPDDFPTTPDLVFQNIRIDSFGFSGSAEVHWDDLTFDPATRAFTGEAAGDLFGLKGGLELFVLEFKESAIVASDIRGALCVPYFDEPVDIQISVDSGGDFAVTLTSAAGEILLKKEELIQLSLKSLTVQKDGSTGSVNITGGLEPLLMSSDGLQWPRLDVTDLSIDSTGKFSIKEAWLDLKELATLDLWGFHFELRRIGLGSEERNDADGDRLWIDLSGGLRLIEQIPVALDVEGFRLTWPQNLLSASNPSLAEIQSALAKIAVEFDGIYLFFGVPDAVEFEGLIRFFKDAQIVGFAGDMALRVPASGFGAEAGLLIGLSFEPAFPFLYVYFGVDLPAGIPLGQSGLALKGAQGMFGLNVGPDKDPDQNWYYDWYKRGPIVGAHPTNKWKPLQNALALGVGVTITTTDGYVKGTRGLIVLAIPGPILIIEGRALILNGLQPNAEPPLRALAVFDGGAKTVQFNVEAEATLIADLLKAYGMLEAFFDFNDLTNWHLYLGQDTPRSRRIRADILKLDNNFLFKADAYLMIDMVGSETLRSRIGASIGFEPNVPDIDPLEVDFAAVLKGDGEVTARPEQFSGELDLSAHIKLSALGVSLRLSAEAGFLTEGPRPLKVGAHVKVKADMPSPLDPVETTLEFEWQSPDPPTVESPLAAIDVHSRVAPRRFSDDPLKDVITIHQFAELNRQWEVPAKLSPQVETDSQPIICFKQKMNSTVDSFARHPDGERHHYDVGLFEFYPSVTTIKLYEHLKRNNDRWANNDTDWTLIASTDENDHKPLPGVWLVESEPESPQAPSPRKIQFWTDNPLSSSAAALGPGYKLLRGAIETGKSLAERILVDYPDLMECGYTKAKSVCVTFDAATEITIERGESWEYKNLLFLSRQTTAQLQTVGGSAPVSPNLVGGVVDTIRNVGGRIVDTLLRRPAPHKCLFIDGYIDIHFRQRVKHVRIVFCEPSKMPESVIRIRVTTKRGIRTQAELAASGQNRKSITLEDIRSCNVSVNSTLTVSEQEWVFDADEGFDCINIIRMDKFAIREICYTTVAEVDRSRLALEQCKNNADLPIDGQTLRPGAYYRLDVMTRVRGELNDDDLPFDPDSTLGQMLVPAYEALASALAEDVLPRNYHQTCFFQTEAPPTNLRPYVKWCSPQDLSERFFSADNISIRFLRSNLDAMFRSPFTLTVRVKDSTGQQAQGFATQWRRANSATLFPEETVWENHRADLNWPDHPIAQDNMLLVRSGAALSPLSRYVFELVGRTSVTDTTELVLFSSTFTTSMFKSFKDLAGSFKREQLIEGKRSSIPALTELQTSTRVLARARYNFEHAEIDFRFGTLEGGREGLEQSRLERREKTAAHDAKFSQFVEDVADLYYRPLEQRLELYLVTDPATRRVIALWIRSPETLDVRLAVVENPTQTNSPVVDQVGRTVITLQQMLPTQRNRLISIVPNSDSTQLLIVLSSGRLDSGSYVLTLTYHRDYGDELRSMDHRYDRPVESAADGSSPIEVHLKFRI